MKQSQKGFTLIELLVVIVILATLASVVFVALNPAKRLADARNARRTTDVDTVLTAVHQYVVDNGGSFPAGIGITGTEYQIGTTNAGCNTACAGANAACADIGTQLAKYLKSAPIDPNGGSTAATGYSIIRDTNNIVTVKACNAEGTTISVSR